MFSAQDNPVAVQKSILRPVEDVFVKGNLTAELIRGSVPDIDPLLARREQVRAVAVREQILEKRLTDLQNGTGRDILIFEIGSQVRNIEV